MTFSDAELRFLARQPRGHLATVGPNGTPQVKPLGFTYNPTLGTIDLTGFNMSDSAKYRNVRTNPNVAFVVDEVTEQSMDGAHFLEVRGVAETAVGTHDWQGHLAPEIIRIHPRRIVSFNVDPDQPGFAARDVSPTNLRDEVAYVRAVEVSRFGGPDVLELREVREPEPGLGQVVVEASACDVLFVDTMIRSGRGADYFPIRPPYVPGNGVGGTVAAVGSGVDPGWLGRPVVAHTGGPGGTGGYAEMVAVDLDAIAPVPPGVDLLDAAAVLHDGPTARRVLEKTVPPQEGEWALILGAAGGMGMLLVQLLVTRGTSVVGAARGSTKCDIVLGAGATTAIDYGEAGWTDAVLDATRGRRPTVVLDGVGGTIGEEAFGLIANGGRFSAHGTPSGSFAPIDPGDAARRGVTVTTIADLQYGEGDRSRLLTTILAEVGSGRLAPLVGQTFALAEASKAHLAIEGRETVAKTLLLAESR